MIKKSIAVLLPFKDHFTNSNAGSASIWIKDFNKNSKYKKFVKQFNDLLLDLAKQIVKDGEGAKKLISISVKNAKTYLAARNIALSVANSPLVKTLFSSNELNFGRIFMAIGKSNEIIDQEKISFSLDNQLLAKNGMLLIKNNSNKIKKCMKRNQVEVLQKIHLVMKRN